MKWPYFQAFLMGLTPVAVAAAIVGVLIFVFGEHVGNSSITSCQTADGEFTVMNDPMTRVMISGDKLEWTDKHGVSHVRSLRRPYSCDIMQ